MTPRRLLEESPHSMEAQLLRVGQAMQPPPTLYQETLASLGLVAKTASAATVATDMVGAAKLAATTAAPTVFGTALATTAMKGLAIGVVVGGSIWGAAEVASPMWRSTDPVRANIAKSDGQPIADASNTALENSNSNSNLNHAFPAASSTTPPQEATVTTPPQDATVTTPPRDFAMTSASPRGSASSTPFPRRPASAGAARERHSLGAEVELLDRSRHALETGQLELALQCLTQHARQFSSPRLAQEASILRAQVLERQGRRSAGTAVFDADSGESPDSARSEDQDPSLPLAK